MEKARKAFLESIPNRTIKRGNSLMLHTVKVWQEQKISVQKFWNLPSIIHLMPEGVCLAPWHIRFQARGAKSGVFKVTLDTGHWTNLSEQVVRFGWLDAWSSLVSNARGDQITRDPNLITISAKSEWTIDVKCYSRWLGGESFSTCSNKETHF